MRMVTVGIKPPLASATARTTSQQIWWRSRRTKRLPASSTRCEGTAKGSVKRLLACFFTIRVLCRGLHCLHCDFLYFWMFCSPQYQQQWIRCNGKARVLRGTKDILNKASINYTVTKILMARLWRLRKRRRSKQEPSRSRPRRKRRLRCTQTAQKDEVNSIGKKLSQLPSKNLYSWTSTIGFVGLNSLYKPIKTQTVILREASLVQANADEERAIKKQQIKDTEAMLGTDLSPWPWQRKASWKRQESSTAALCTISNIFQHVWMKVGIWEVFSWFQMMCNHDFTWNNSGQRFNILDSQHNNLLFSRRRGLGSNLAVVVNGQPSIASMVYFEEAFMWTGCWNWRVFYGENAYHSSRNIRDRYVKNILRKYT